MTTTSDINPSEWKPYTGEYEKRWYDIKLKSGSVILSCWPNAGTFHSGDGDIIDGEAVAEIRECADQDSQPSNPSELSERLYHYVMPIVADGVGLAERVVEKYKTIDKGMEDGTEYDDWMDELVERNIAELVALIEATVKEVIGEDEETGHSALELTLNLHPA